MIGKSLKRVIKDLFVTRRERELLERMKQVTIERDDARKQLRGYALEHGSDRDAKEAMERR